MKLANQIKRLFVVEEERSSSPNSPSTSLAKPSGWLTQLFSPRSKSGADVTAKTVVGISGVWRAINLICESIASMPLEVIKDEGDRISTVKNHPVYRLLNVEPHDLYTPFDWRYAMTCICILNGNSYSHILRDSDGKPVKLRILDPVHHQVHAFLDEKDRLYYKVDGYRDKPIFARDIIHFKWMTTNGLAGLDTISTHQDTFGFGLSARDLGNYFFKNGAHIGGYIKHPGVLNDTQYDRLTGSWNRAYSGVDKAGTTPILEEGAEFVPYEFDPQKAQMIEAQKFNIEDVARVFGVPPHLLASLDRATNNNIEHLSLEFAKYTIRPWATRQEQEIDRKLFSKADRDNYSTRFDMSSFMRGDMQSLADYLHKMVNGGILSINDARKKINMNPVEGGDFHFIPLQSGALQPDGTLKTPQQPTEVKKSKR